MTTANVVYSGPADQKPQVEERIITSGATIKPGHLVLTSSDKWINHNLAGDGANFRIIDMDTLKQKLVTDTLTALDSAVAFVPVPGEYYNFVLADSQTVTKGLGLTSNGDGTLKIATVTGATVDIVLCYADEAVTTSGATARIRARVATAGYQATA